MATNSPLEPTDFAPAERASAAQLQSDRALFENKDLTGQVLDSIPDIIIVLNEQRQAIYLNQSGLEEFGVTLDIAVGKRPGELVLCAHADDPHGGCGTSTLCRTCGAVRAILSSLRGNDSVQDCQIAQASGSTLELRVWAKPLHIGERTFSVFTARNVSDENRRKLLERIFYHDVLNTASLVAMCSDFLASDSYEAQQAVLSDLTSAAQRLLNEVQSQRLLHAAEYGELKIDQALIEVTPFLEELCRSYERHELAATKHIQLSRSETEVFLLSDIVLLGRVIGNMIKNALEATQDGGTISVSYALNDGLVRFAIHNASYIPRNLQPLLFSRLISSKGPGRGLGTYSMKMLSERYMHGQVWFESSEDLGTTFYAEYPQQLE